MVEAVFSAAKLGCNEVRRLPWLISRYGWWGGGEAWGLCVGDSALQDADRLRGPLQGYLRRLALEAQRQPSTRDRKQHPDRGGTRRLMDSREEQDRSGGLSGRVVDRTSGRDKQSYSEDDDEYDNDITLVDIPPQLAKSGGKGGNAVGTGTEAEHGGGAREGERGRSNKRKAPVIDDLDIRPARMPHPSRNVKSNDNGDVNHSPVPSLAPTLPPISSIMNMPGMAYSRAPPFALTPSSAPACSTPIRPVPLTPGIPSSASTSTSASAPTHAYAYDPLTPPTARSLGLNGPPPLGSARLLDKLRKEEERGGRSRSLPSSSPLKTSRWASQEGHEHPFLSSPPISSETSRQPAVSPSSRYPQPGRPTPTSSAAAQGGPERLPPLPSPTHGPSSRLAASYRNDHHSGRSTNGQSYFRVHASVTADPELMFSQWPFQHLKSPSAGISTVVRWTILNILHHLQCVLFRPSARRPWQLHLLRVLLA